MANTVETWKVLAWKDEAGREDQMAGPASALTDKVKELKAAKVDYTLEDLGTVETVKEED